MKVVCTLVAFCLTLTCFLASAACQDNEASSQDDALRPLGSEAPRVTIQELLETIEQSRQQFAGLAESTRSAAAVEDARRECIRNIERAAYAHWTGNIQDANGHLREIAGNIDGAAFAIEVGRLEARLAVVSSPFANESLRNGFDAWGSGLRSAGLLSSAAAGVFTATSDADGSGGLWWLIGSGVIAVTGELLVQLGGVAGNAESLREIDGAVRQMLVSRIAYDNVRERIELLKSFSERVDELHAEMRTPMNDWQRSTRVVLRNTYADLGTLINSQEYILLNSLAPQLTEVSRQYLVSLRSLSQFRDAVELAIGTYRSTLGCEVSTPRAAVCDELDSTSEHVERFEAKLRRNTDRIASLVSDLTGLRSLDSSYELIGCATRGTSGP